MTSSQSALIKPKTAQRGAAAVEFALVAIPFFLLMFGAMEFGRLLYLWNTVQEVTRNAARQAVVTDFNDTTAIASIKQSAVFRNTAGAALPAASNITDASVNIRYLNANGGDVEILGLRPLTPGDNIAACLNPVRVDACIRFVEVCVNTGNSTCLAGDMISFVPMISLFSQSGPNSTDLTGLRIPLSTVRMPAESLGFRPNT